MFYLTLLPLHFNSTNFLRGYTFLLTPDKSIIVRSYDCTQ